MQTESMNTIVTANRHKDNLKWNGLVLEYEMKINYLERALAQEESKLRIAEQVRRLSGLATAFLRRGSVDEGFVPVAVHIPLVIEELPAEGVSFLSNQASRQGCHAKDYPPPTGQWSNL